ncbi:MAG: aspartate/glutamate racemase family protein [Clostridiales bacterium]|jgi:glutamate racemase|nr:aspartate/glutamate racemase family protein [Clostridiales bacterium]
MKKNNGPVGVVDSGVGGLTTLLALRKVLPEQEFVYIAPKSFQPFGVLERQQIFDKASVLVHRLQKYNCKAIVIACNTATNVGVCNLSKQYNIPFLGLEPAIKPAVESGAKNILVLTTTATAKQERFIQLKNRFLSKSNIIVSPQQNLASEIENTEAIKELRLKLSKKTIKIDDDFIHQLDSQIKQTVTNILMQHSNIDSIVLGCTHYVFLAHTIKNYYQNKNKKIKLFDGNLGVAKRLQSLI